MQELKPWLNEQDRYDLHVHGMPAIILRNHLGVLCGYLGLPPRHPWHGKPWEELEDIVTVHGGVTYAASCKGGNSEVCHVPKEGEPADVWWIGFDCGHASDYMPPISGDTVDRQGIHDILNVFLEGGMPATDPKAYKDVDYVREELIKVAEQAIVAEAK